MGGSRTAQLLCCRYKASPPHSAVGGRTSLIPFILYLPLFMNRLAGLKVSAPGVLAEDWICEFPTQ